MQLALTLIAAGGVWLLVVLFAISLCRAAQAGDTALDAGCRSAEKAGAGDVLYASEVRQRIADDPEEFDFAAHPRPTRGREAGLTLDIREAAATLRASPDALRAWESRYGYPVSQCSVPGHEPTYRREEVLALAEALQNSLSVASAIGGARAAVTRQ
jgi:hypothetical protein